MTWSTVEEALGLKEMVRNRDLWKALLAEFLGTLLLTLIGCFSTIGWGAEDETDDYAPSMVQIALAFGITVATLAQVRKGMKNWVPVSAASIPVVTASVFILVYIYENGEVAWTYVEQMPSSSNNSRT